MLYQASSKLKMEIPLNDVVKIWRGGCIIRSNFLDIFYAIFKKSKDNFPNILLDKNIAKRIKSKAPGTRRFLRAAIQARVSSSGISSAINYFDAYTKEKMPVNLVQAQRDYFGAHTYLRTDKKGIFHSDWKPALQFWDQVAWFGKM